ncbi:galactose-binding domain-containing protein [Rhodopirellula sallentina]|nr:carbohydrate-binding protein [Rhodopirellula sallentina]
MTRVLCMLSVLAAMGWQHAGAANAVERVKGQNGKATTYYVDAVRGNDSYAGTTIAKPKATISAAAELVQPGDVVLVRGGTYRETVRVPRSGTSDAPIRFGAYRNEKVILSGCDPVTGWARLGNGDIWKANAGTSVWENGRGETLFVGGLLRFTAREKGEYDPLDLSRWGVIEKGDLTTEGFTAKDLTGHGDDFFNGAKVHFHVNDWTIETRRIADYESKTGKVTFDRPTNGVSQKQRFGYIIDSSIKLIDAPREWFHRGEQLYYRTAAGEDARDLDIEIRRRAYAFDVRDRSHVVIEKFTFRGVSVHTNDESNSNTYRGNRFYGYDKDNVGRFRLGGSDNLFRDNEVSQTWGSALTIGHSRNRIINNYFHDIGYTATARVLAMSGDSHLVSHNTVSKFARSFLDGYPDRSEFAYNVFKDGGRLSWDTGVFDGDAGRGNGGGCIVHHNVFSHSQRKGIYAAFYAGTDLVIHHNIVYGVGPNTVRHGYPNFLKYYHNTFIGPPPVLDTDVSDRAVQMSINNNLMLATEDCFSLGVDCRGNHVYNAGDFVNLAQNDFRLSASSSAIDCGVVLPGINDGYRGDAPDAGALEAGESMWKVGHDFRHPPEPKYEWRSLPGTNIFANGQFGTPPEMIPSESVTSKSDSNSEKWLVKGTPTYFNGNAWNHFNIGLARYGNHTVRLRPGDSMRRTFGDLKPNTTYTVAANVKLTDHRMECSDPDAKQASLASGEHRGVKYAQGVRRGDWLRFDNVDFGPAEKYNQMELVFSRPPGQKATQPTKIEIRVGDQKGTTIGEFVAQANVHDSWYSSIADIPPLVGKQTVCLVAVSENASSLRLANIRLRSSEIPAEGQLTIAARQHGGKEATRRIGSADWIPGYESLSFTTGHHATSFELLIENNGWYDAYLDRLAIFESTPRDPSTREKWYRAAPVDGDLVASDGEVRRGVNANGYEWWQVSFPQVVTPGRIELFGRDSKRLDQPRLIRVSLWERDPGIQGKVHWSQLRKTDGTFWRRDGVVINGGDISDDAATRLASAPTRVIRVECIGQKGLGEKSLGLTHARVFSATDRPPASNVAQAGIASQSSDHYVVTGKADQAIDGDIFPTARFTTTQLSKSPWWQVELKESVPIDQIRIFNRNSAADRISTFRVSVFDTDPDQGGKELWGREYSYQRGDIPSAGSLMILGRHSDSHCRLDSVRGGTFVRVQESGTGMLSLVEVQVWTTPH